MTSRHRRSKSKHIDWTRRRATKNSLRATITKKQVEEMVQKLMDESDDRPRNAFDPHRVMRIDRNDEFADWGHYPFNKEDEEEMIDLTSTRSQSVISEEEHEQDKENKQQQEQQEQQEPDEGSNVVTFKVLQNDDIRPSFNNDSEVPEKVNEKEEETVNANESMLNDLRQRYDFINSQNELHKQQMRTEPDNKTKSATTEEGPIFDNVMLDQVTDLVMALEEGFKTLEKAKKQNTVDFAAVTGHLTEKVNSIHEEIIGMREEQRRFHEQQAELMRSQLIDRQEQFKKLQGFIKRKFTDIVRNQRKFQQSSTISNEQPQKHDENGSEQVNEDATFPAEFEPANSSVTNNESPNVNVTQSSYMNEEEPPHYSTNTKEIHKLNVFNPRPTKIQRTTGQSKLDASNIFKSVSERHSNSFDIAEILSTGVRRGKQKKTETETESSPPLKQSSSSVTTTPQKKLSSLYARSRVNDSSEIINVNSSDKSRSSSPFEQSPTKTPTRKSQLRPSGTSSGSGSGSGSSSRPHSQSLPSPRKAQLTQQIHLSPEKQKQLDLQLSLKMINKCESFSPVKKLTDSPFFLTSTTKTKPESKSKSISPSQRAQLQKKDSKQEKEEEEKGKEEKKNDMNDSSPSSKDPVRSSSGESNSSHPDYSIKPSNPFQRLAQKRSRSQNPIPGKERLLHQQKPQNHHLLKLRVQTPPPLPPPGKSSIPQGATIPAQSQSEAQSKQQKQQKQQQQQQHEPQELQLERLSTHKPPETPSRERGLKLKLNPTLSTTRDLIEEWTKDFTADTDTTAPKELLKLLTVLQRHPQPQPQPHPQPQQQPQPQKQKKTICLPEAMALLNKHHPKNFQENLNPFIKRLNVIRVLELLKQEFCNGDLHRAVQLLDSYIAANEFSLDWWSIGLTLAEEQYETIEFDHWFKYYYGSGLDESGVNDGDGDGDGDGGKDADTQGDSQGDAQGDGEVHELLGFKMATHYSDLALSCRMALCEAIVNESLKK
ncbi:unnamed protein product [Ambrosiozyma monospora]|uniref:Unnamed protein product n=1 Tax=Ambrosiozyma monospora TaxID=43982 RepID=A0A9W6YTH7_AMBMO|nr:unnamed protein product [Ambrosiozyma monospora]